VDDVDPGGGGAGRGDLVSVVIAARDAEAFVQEALVSVQRQTHADWEAIVVDDGSRDHTADIVGQMAATEPRIRLVRQAPGGVIAARNHGLTKAQGRWVAFLDADDLWRPEKLARQLDVAGSRSGAVPQAVGTFAAYFGRRRGPIGTLGMSIGAAEMAQLRAGSLSPFCVSSLLVDHDALRTVGGFDPIMEEVGNAEDLDLMSRLARYGVEFSCIPEALTLYRLRIGSISQAAPERVQRATEFVQARAKADLFGEPPPSTEKFRQRPLNLPIRKLALQATLRTAAIEYVDGSLPRAITFAAWAFARAPRYTLGRLVKKARTRRR
jgi:glycosyltransferase involved in cell wall biosynthesis